MADLLDELLTAVAPFVAQARLQRSTYEATGMVRIYPSPVHLDVVYRSDAGDYERLYRCDGTPAIAELLARCLTAGVDQLPEPMRGQVRSLVAAGQRQLIAIVDITVGTASGVLVGADKDSAFEPEFVFMLRREDTRH